MTAQQKNQKNQGFVQKLFLTKFALYLDKVFRGGYTENIVFYPEMETTDFFE